MRRVRIEVGAPDLEGRVMPMECYNREYTVIRDNPYTFVVCIYKDGEHIERVFAKKYIEYFKD